MSEFTRVATLQHLALSLILGAFAAAAQAQAYPSRAVKLIVPFAAGGPLDLTTRVIGRNLTASLNQPFVVENRPGAGGNIGAEAAAKSPPDGYTLLVTVDTVLVANPSLFQKVPFDVAKDFRAVSTLATFDLALVVHPAVPARTVSELLALAKQRSMTFASGGHGNPGHLVMELLLENAGVRMTHVPYKGNAPAVADLVGGQVQAAFVASPGVLAYIRSGKLKALAVSGKNRSIRMPEVPTIAEAGYPNAGAEFAFMVLAPAGTSDFIVDRLQQEIASALKDSNVQEQLDKQGVTPLGSSPEETAARIRSDGQKWSRVIKALNLKID